MAKTTKLLKSRPYWHVDAKWLCAITLLALLAVTLPLAIMYQLTDKTSGTKIIAYTLMGMTSPDGIDSEQGLAELKTQLRQTGSVTLNFGGVPATLTTHDAETLTPRELRLKVVGGFAGQFYDQGARGLAVSRHASEEATAKAVSDATFLSPFTREGHAKLKVWLVALGSVCALLLALVIFFSYHAGRLVSPGLTLALAGLPGVLFWTLAQGHSAAPTTARTDNESNPLGAVSGIFSYLQPLIAQTAANTYLIVLFSGLALLVVAPFARLLWRRHSARASTSAS
jgi:hypothetical protein